MAVTDDVTVVPEPTRERLNDRQLVDYRHHREQLIDWMANLGKDPKRADGYAHETVRRRANNADLYYRWVWNYEDGYTTDLTTEHADEYTKQLAYGDHSDTHRSNLQKTVRMLYRWRAWEFGEDEWEPDITFSSRATTQPRDYLTRDERTAVREASLEYGTVPHYCSLSPSERADWKRHLAQRYKKPIEDIGREDFERANGFKIPSLVNVSLDAGLRPIEVERATTEWVDIENSVLRIPADDSAKNDENWTVSLRESTAEMVDEWLRERPHYEKYDDTDRLWLTREGNPYQSTALTYVLDTLTDIADISTENRSLTWYAIRHSVGTYMAREEGLAAAQAQLRHRSARTTMKYDNAPADDRRDALDRMG